MCREVEIDIAEYISRMIFTLISLNTKISNVSHLGNQQGYLMDIPSLLPEC